MHIQRAQNLSLTFSILWNLEDVLLILMLLRIYD